MHLIPSRRHRPGRFSHSIAHGEREYRAVLDFDHARDVAVRGFAVNYAFGSYGDVASIEKECLLLGDALSLENQRWKAHVLNPAAAVDVDAISETVSNLLSALERAGADAVNLQGLDEQTINAEHLVAVLRTTFVCRNAIQGWKNALQQCQIKLEQAGIEPGEVLAGLQ